MHKNVSADGKKDQKGIWKRIATKIFPYMKKKNCNNMKITIIKSWKINNFYLLIGIKKQKYDIKEH